MVDQLKEWAGGILDKYGLPMLLLLGITWFVILPIANAYKSSLESVAATNQLLKDEQVKNDLDDEKRVHEISEKMNMIESKLDQILQRIK
jgi:hypothetical protein